MNYNQIAAGSAISLISELRRQSLIYGGSNSSGRLVDEVGIKCIERDLVPSVEAKRHPVPSTDCQRFSAH